jgi:hypothetical protein
VDGGLTALPQFSTYGVIEDAQRCLASEGRCLSDSVWALCHL